MTKKFTLSFESKSGIDLPESNIRAITMEMALKFPYLQVRRVKVGG